MSENTLLSEALKALMFVRFEDGSYGGWRTWLLIDKMSKFQEKFLLCELCHGLLRGAQMYEIESKQEFRCSVCLPKNAPVVEAQINQRSVDEKLIVCPLKEEGCEWSDVITQVFSHLNECDFFPVECPLGCVSEKEQIKRKFLDEHQKDYCLMRLINCESCDREMRACEMNEHLSICEEYFVLCPNSCIEGEDIRRVKRKHLPSHLGEECPLQLVECPYAEYGCKERMERRLINQHEEEYIQVHFKNALVKIKQQSHQIECLNKKMREMEENQFNEISHLKYHSVIEMTRQRSKIDFLISSTNYSPRGSFLEWRITGVTNRILSQGVLYSDKLYVGLYKCHAKIEWDRESLGYVACFIQFLKGDYDDKLTWPCKGLKYTFILRNWKDDTQNYVRKYEIDDESILLTPESFQKPTEFGNTSFGLRKFISHHRIRKDKYLKSDSILLEIKVN